MNFYVASIKSWLLYIYIACVLFQFSSVKKTRVFTYLRRDYAEITGERIGKKKEKKGKRIVETMAVFAREVNKLLRKKNLINRTFVYGYKYKQVE